MCIYLIDFLYRLWKKMKKFTYNIKQLLINDKSVIIKASFKLIKVILYYL